MGGGRESGGSADEEGVFDRGDDDGALLLSSGLALAAVLTGTEGSDAIEGTSEDDSISGLGGDVVYTDGEDLISDDCEKIMRGLYFDAWDVNP